MGFEIVFGAGVMYKIKAALDRNSTIQNIRTEKHIYYLWFIGVDPPCQKKGLGSNLLKEVIKKSKLRKRPIYLETYLDSNVLLYKKNGFKSYHKLDFGYPVYCMKREFTL